jgi:hypothetical protein
MHIQRDTHTSTQAGREGDGIEVKGRYSAGISTAMARSWIESTPKSFD